MTRRTAGFCASAVAALAACVIGGMTASAGTSAAWRSQANTLAGTWESTINLPAPAPPVQSLQVYNRNGGWVETSNQDPRSRSAMYGSWERIHERLYAATGVHFLFNPETGAYIGTRRINRTVELSDDGQTFKLVAKVTTFDTNGNVLGTFTVRGTGQRLQTERIPEQP
jgi:hypothetical protein